MQYEPRRSISREFRIPPRDFATRAPIVDAHSVRADGFASSDGSGHLVRLRHTLR